MKEQEKEKQTGPALDGTIRFILFLIAILVLLNFSYCFTWNRP